MFEKEVKKEDNILLYFFFQTGYSYGFGFVNYTREEDASRAIDTFNGYQLRNKRLKVSVKNIFLLNHHI